MPAFTISLAMIVKNEEDHLAATLESAKAAVDEIIIVVPIDRRIKYADLT